MRKRIIKCCCIGERQREFSHDYLNNMPVSYQKYLQKMENLIETHIKNGVFYFVCGAMNEIELAFAETILKLREKYPYIELEIDLAFREQSIYFTQSERLRFKNILNRANTLLYLFNLRDYWTKIQRDYYIVDMSLHVIAVWNGERDNSVYQAITYAHKQEKQVDVITFSNVSN